MEKMFDAGDLVWALLRPFPWWPGIACHVPGKDSCLVRKGDKEYLSVVFIEEVPTTALVPLQNIRKLNSLEKSERRPGGFFYSNADGWELAAKLAKVFLKIPNSGRLAAIDVRLQMAKTNQRLRKQMAKNRKRQTPASVAAAEGTNRKHSLGSRESKVKQTVANQTQADSDEMELQYSRSTTSIEHWPSSDVAVVGCNKDPELQVDCQSVTSDSSSRCSSSLSLQIGCNASVTGFTGALCAPTPFSCNFSQSPNSSVRSPQSLATITSSAASFLAHIDHIASVQAETCSSRCSFADDSSCSDSDSMSIGSSPPQSPTSMPTQSFKSNLSPKSNPPLCSFAPKHRWLNTFLSSGAQLITSN